MSGIFVLAGMSLQFPAGTIRHSVNEVSGQSLEIDPPLLRFDLWPTWLEVGCLHASYAHAAGSGLSPHLSDPEKCALLTSELQAGLVAITALAFAIDGFYDIIRMELGPHPHQPTWKKKRTSRAAQVAETFRYRLKLNPAYYARVRAILEQLFVFRGRAVHPSGQFVRQNYRPQIDSGVHPHLITFSGPHAVQCRALVLVVVDELIRRAAEISNGDANIEWIERGLAEVRRLSDLYRIPGDDQIAYETE